jgi:hypothetical protein
MVASIHGGRRLRAWTAWFLEKRRRGRVAASGHPVPAAPSDLDAEDGGGLASLTWSMAGVDFEDGCSVEGRDLDKAEAFHEVGRTGPDVAAFDFDTGGGVNFEFRVRAYNAAGYSAYSNVASISLT